MRRFIAAAAFVGLLALVGVSYYNAGTLVDRADAEKARADQLQVNLDRARAACTRVNDLIPAESRAMWPANATPEERLAFVLDQQQRNLDARSGNHFPGGARLTIRFMEVPVTRIQSPRQQSLVSQE